MVGALSDGKDVWPVSVSFNPSVNLFSNLHFTSFLSCCACSRRSDNQQNNFVINWLPYNTCHKLSISSVFLPALVPPLSNVKLHGAESVDGETLVRVDGDTEEAGIGVDQLVLVPDHGVPEDTSVTEECEIRHVL